MNTTDNFDQFKNLLDKHLYFLPLGFVEGEGYDNKFTRYSQIYVIIRMFLVDFHNNKIFDNSEILSKLRSYNSLFITHDAISINLSKELEIIDFLLSLEQLPDLKIM